jgi:diguanylate cyclase (GGDEF)-like protein/PAS domain S-box-containing protein
MMHIDDSWILQALMENTVDSIFIKDRQCRIWRVSRKMGDSLGITDLNEIYGKTDIELFGEEFGKKTMQDDTEVMETGTAKTGIIDKHLQPNGEYNWTLSTKLPLKNEKGEIVGLLGITREINDLKTEEYEYQWLATHDPLTCLPNRYLLMDRIDQAIFQSNRTDNSFAILFIDLNGFKQVNDFQGHNQGDKYLIRVANELLQNMRSSDTVARLGGDEFVILLNEVHDASAAEKVAQKTSELIKERIDPINKLITASIGISLYPRDGLNPENLIKAADLSMYRAKRQRLP